MKDKLFVIAIIFGGLVALILVLMPYWLPAVIVKFGKHELAEEKIVFLLPEGKAVEAEERLRAFADQYQLTFNLIRLPQKSPSAFRLIMTSDERGEFRVNDTHSDREYVCYFYRHAATVDPKVMLRDFRVLFIELGANEVRVDMEGDSPGP